MHDLISGRSVAVFLLLLLLTACSNQNFPEFLLRQSAQSDDLLYRKLSLRQGQRITLTLASNPGTGFTWVMKPIGPHDPIILQESGFQPSERTDLVGVSGRMFWTFKARIPGRIIVELHYARPWETSAAPCRRAFFDFTVKP